MNSPSLMPPTQGDRTKRDVRVLFLSKVLPYPPAVAGDAVYSRGMIEALSDVLHLTVLCSDSGASRRSGDGIDWHVVGPQRRGRAGSTLSRWPLVAWKGATPDWHGELDLLLKRTWDAIVVDNLGAVHTLPKLERYRREHPGTKLVYVSHEYEFEVRRAKYGAYGMGIGARVASRLDLLKVRRWEECLLRSCDLVTVINDNDAEVFRRINPQQRFVTLTPGYDGLALSERTISDNTPRRVILLGGRKPQQKRQILIDWMKVGYTPLTQAGIEIVIVGDMDDDLREELSRNYPKSCILGFIDDTTSLIASARAGIIADTVGGGFKLRMLSYVFQRLPIIGLSEAISGLPTRNGSGYIGVRNLIELNESIISNIDNLDRLNSIQNTAFADCYGKFSWKRGAEKFLRAIGE